MQGLRLSLLQTAGKAPEQLTELMDVVAALTTRMVAAESLTVVVVDSRLLTIETKAIDETAVGLTVAEISEEPVPPRILVAVARIVVT